LGGPKTNTSSGANYFLVSLNTSLIDCSPLIFLNFPHLLYQSTTDNVSFSNTLILFFITSSLSSDLLFSIDDFSDLFVNLVNKVLSATA